jgi:hypothetical protein
LPIVFVTLVSRAGYLRQELDAAGLPGYDVTLAVSWCRAPIYG